MIVLKFMYTVRGTANLDKYVGMTIRKNLCKIRQTDLHYSIITTIHSPMSNPTTPICHQCRIEKMASRLAFLTT
ncbi:hypothetical protein AGMMS49992_08970 [Clostridia bacterium]|nr:hypothetical protein AGMMS49992_08970 [Clostridia bacterium]